MEKYVLTGGPCCGKTSVIEELKRRGHVVLEEVAREVIKDGFVDPEKKQLEIYRRQLEREKEFENREGVLFLDRSAVDGIAYSLIDTGRLPGNLTMNGFKKDYKQIFFLERFPFANDGLRLEDNEYEAERLHQQLYHTYLALDYAISFVSKMSVKERADFILDKIKKH